MNIAIFLLSLIIFTLSYANKINSLKLLKRYVTFDKEAFENSLSEECRNEYENSEYNKCMPTIDLYNYKNACSDIQSEECQAFYKNPLKYYPICKDIPDFREMYQSIMIEILKQGLDIKCQTDESGNMCPFSIYLITDSDAVDVLKDQCESKKCTESLISVYQKLNMDQYAAYENSPYTSGSFTYQELNIKKNIISRLESEECQSLHTSSSTIAIKTNNFLLIVLLLLLLSLF